MTEEARTEEEAKPDPEFTDVDLRMFIIEHMADAEIDGRILVFNMEMVFQWAKNEVVPKLPSVKK